MILIFDTQITSISCYKNCFAHFKFWTISNARILSFSDKALGNWRLAKRPRTRHIDYVILIFRTIHIILFSTLTCRRGRIIVALKASFLFLGVPRSIAYNAWSLIRSSRHSTHSATLHRLQLLRLLIVPNLRWPRFISRTHRKLRMTILLLAYQIIRWQFKLGISLPGRVRSQLLGPSSSANFSLNAPILLPLRQILIARPSRRLYPIREPLGQACDVGFLGARERLFDGGLRGVAWARVLSLAAWLTYFDVF